MALLSNFIFNCFSVLFIGLDGKEGHILCGVGRFWRDQQGAVSIYLLLILIPIFLFCGILIDLARWKTAEKETEQAVKAGVRSALSGYSDALQAYGLYALPPGAEDAKKVFEKTVEANLSGSLQQEGFRFVNNMSVPSSARLTPMYPLANHTVFERQILEEMKLRAPLIYAVELTDKFKTNSLLKQVGEASQFTERAREVERLLKERDKRLDEAWDLFLDIRQQELDANPYYSARLNELNALSEKIGIHTLEEVQTTLSQAKQQVADLKRNIEGMNDSIYWMARAAAAAGAAEALNALFESRAQLEQQLASATSMVKEYEQLLQYLQDYSLALGMLKVKAEDDAKRLATKMDRFANAMKEAKKANEALNAEVRKIIADADAGTGLPVNEVFKNVKLISSEELEQFETDTSAGAAQFNGLNAQIQDNLMFTKAKYDSASKALVGFVEKVEAAYTAQNASQTERKSRASANSAAQKAERTKAQATLDQIKRAIGSCSIFSSVDPYREQYEKLQGNPAVAGSAGYYQAYMQINQENAAAEPVPNVDLEDSERAGLSSTKLLSALGDMLGEIRDEFFVDEFALSKFNYRTFGLEKDANGQLKTPLTLSDPAGHALGQQEVEYILYGASSCAANQSFAFSEMFAVRLAVGITEAFLEPRNEALALGTPLLVVLAAVTEGAIRAELDMAKLVQGEAVPLSRKLSPAITLSYKDYLRIFMLLHSRNTPTLSRMQALLQLNTGINLAQSSTYVSGAASSSLKLWFMPRAMSLLNKTGMTGCVADDLGCRITRMADYTY